MEDPETAQEGNKEQAASTTPTIQEQANTSKAQAVMATNATKERTHKKKARMLLALAKLKGANIGQAAQLAGIDRATHYKWLHSDPIYKEKAEATFEELGDTLEGVAYSMALEKNPQVLLATLKAKFKERGWGEDKTGVAVQVNTQVNEKGEIWEIKRMFDEARAEAKDGIPKNDTAVETEEDRTVKSASVTPRKTEKKKE